MLLPTAFFVLIIVVMGTATTTTITTTTFNTYVAEHHGRPLIQVGVKFEHIYGWEGKAFNPTLYWENVPLKYRGNPFRTPHSKLSNPIGNSLLNLPLKPLSKLFLRPFEPRTDPLLNIFNPLLLISNTF
jgi:hypothetical protein